jgi:hypothetical protein
MDPSSRPAFSVELIKEGSQLSKSSTEIGLLTLQGTRLGFLWTSNASKPTWKQQSVQLRNCALRIREADDNTVVQLRHPIEVESKVLIGNELSVTSAELTPRPKYDLILKVAQPELPTSPAFQTIQKTKHQVTITSEDPNVPSFALTLRTENKTLDLEWQSAWRSNNKAEVFHGSLLAEVSRRLEKVTSEINKIANIKPPTDMAELAKMRKQEKDLQDAQSRLSTVQTLLVTLEGSKVQASIQADLEGSMIEVATITLELTSSDK